MGWKKLRGGSGDGNRVLERVEWIVEVAIVLVTEVRSSFGDSGSGSGSRGQYRGHGGGLRQVQSK